MSRTGDADHWARLVRSLRGRCGLSQRALAEQLSVDQTTVSRWERSLDLPALRHRRVMRDMMRRDYGGNIDRILKMRVQFAAWPASLMKEGAIFLETSPTHAAEVRVAKFNYGDCLYGRFGAQTDEVTAEWEHMGIFSGELAMTISLNELVTPTETIYVRCLDTPHVSSDGEIWCFCEIKRITAEEYAANKSHMGGALLPIAYDVLS